MRKIDKGSPEYDFVRQLLENIKCVVCSAPYDEDDVAIMGQQEELWMLMVSCHQCGTQGIILAMVKEEEQVELVIDLTPEESERVRNLPAISGDDVLAVHRLLRDFEGDFTELLGEDLIGD
jgi:uncharacterized Zn finger protein